MAGYNHEYKVICSSETLYSGTKGFFKDFTETIINHSGNEWIKSVFGKLSNDDQRISCIFTDKKINNIVIDTFLRVQYLFRDKDAQVSKTKRLEGINFMIKNDEKALLCFSQAVLRAPIIGKVTTVDNGFSLALALFFRAQVLVNLRDYNLAFDDLNEVIHYNLPLDIRSEVEQKLQECKNFIENSKTSLVSHESSDKDGQINSQRKLPKLSGGPHPFLSGLSNLVEIQETSIAGKHAVAREDIHIGDTIACEMPLASCLLPQFYGTHCHHCFARLRAPVGCPMCSSVAFCQRNCRNEAIETYHKYECKILALLIGSGMSVLSMLALRMVTQIGLKGCINQHNILTSKLISQNCPKEENKIEVKDAEVTNEMLNTAKVDDNCEMSSTLSKSAKRRLRKKKLEKNYSKVEVEPSNIAGNDGIENVKNELFKGEIVDNRAFELVTLNTKRTPVDFLERSLMAGFLLKCLDKVDFFESTSSKTSESILSNEQVAVGSILLRNLQLLQFNAHEIYETRINNEHRFHGSKTVYLGVAIYPNAARFNHDCYPAVTRYFVGRSIVLKAIRPLKSGEVIAENYGPIFTKRNLKERTRSLTSRYWFQCTCKACTEDWPTFDNLINYPTRLRCTSENCQGLLAQPRQLDQVVKCTSCQKKIKLKDRIMALRKCEDIYSSGIESMEKENPKKAIEQLTQALEEFHKIAAAPHRETHLAEIALASSMADIQGNVWKPPL